MRRDMDDENDDVVAARPTKSSSSRFTRSRGGCLNCRVQKKKCNEAHPTCSRCERLRRQCVWPTKKLDARDMLQARCTGDKGKGRDSDDSPPVHAEDKSMALNADTLASMIRARKQEEIQNPGGLKSPPTPQTTQTTTSTSPELSETHLALPEQPVPSTSAPPLSAVTRSNSARSAPTPPTLPPAPNDLYDPVFAAEPHWPVIDSATGSNSGSPDWAFVDHSLNFLMEPAGLLEPMYFEPWKEPQANQTTKITADFIRVLIHYTGTVGYRCFITQFQQSVIPAYRQSKMLWATATAYHGSYVALLFAQQANRRDYPEHPARASAIQAMEQELQQVVDKANEESSGAVATSKEGGAAAQDAIDYAELFRDGMAMLEAALTGPSPGMRFKEILGTLLNVVGYSHTTQGTEAFWHAADRCMDFVQRYQPAKPAAFDIGAALGLEYRPLCVWIALDVSSAVARGTKLNSTYVQHTVVQDPFKELQGLEWLTKANDAIFACLAQAAALAYELDGRAPRPGPEQERADQLWRAINSSTSPVNPSCISNRVICLIFHELWREGTRIYFHQCVCRRNLLFPALRTSVESTLSLISLLETSRRSAPPALALPLWLSAAAAISQQERHRFRSVFKGLGPSVAWQDALEDLEKLWSLTDANGDPQNWRELVRQGIIRPPPFR